jgi:hypothetical protein
MNTIPFFYYDVLARMIPGGLLLALLRAVGLRAPAPWPDLLTGQEAWKAVLVPLVLAAMAYLLGALMDGFFRFFFKLAERFGRRQYQTVISEQVGLRPMPPGASSVKNFQHDLWQWLALVAGPENTAAFSLAHRFQAESRLFVLSSIPAAFGAGASVYHWLKIPGASWISLVSGLVVLVAFIRSAFNSEKNRWIWALAAAAHLEDKWPTRWKAT